MSRIVVSCARPLSRIQRSGSSSTRRCTTSPSLSTYTQAVQVSCSRRTSVSPCFCVAFVSEITYQGHTAGQDATEAFFGLHRHEVLLRPQYARLQIGTVAGQKERVTALSPGEPSSVPYAEPAWLTPGYHSPYYTDSHRIFQKAVRKFFEEVVQPDAIKCEDNGKRISQEVVDKLWCVSICKTQSWLADQSVFVSSAR